MTHHATMPVSVQALLDILDLPEGVKLECGVNLTVNVTSDKPLPADEVQLLHDRTGAYRGFVPNCCCTVFGNGESHGEG